MFYFSNASDKYQTLFGAEFGAHLNKFNDTTKHSKSQKPYSIVLYGTY